MKTWVVGSRICMTRAPRSWGGCGEDASPSFGFLTQQPLTVGQMGQPLTKIGAVIEGENWREMLGVCTVDLKALGKVLLCLVVSGNSGQAWLKTCGRDAQGITLCPEKSLCEEAPGEMSKVKGFIHWTTEK